MGPVAGEDEAIADAIEAAICVRGGVLSAHLLPAVVPWLRRALLDRRLLQFLEAFPQRFRVSRDPQNPDLAEVSTLQQAGPRGSGESGTAAAAQAACAEHALADAIVAALGRYPLRSAEKGAGAAPGRAAPLEAAEGDGGVWVPLPWLLREKGVSKRLQAHVLHSPRLEYFFHQNPAVVASAGEKVARWATLSMHLWTFFDNWPMKHCPLSLRLRERPDLCCNLERRGKAQALQEAGFVCPCRMEAAGTREAAGLGGRAAEEEVLLQRVLRVLGGRGRTVQAVGTDLSVRAALRRCQHASAQGLLRWMCEQPSLAVSESGASGWWVRPAGAGAVPPQMPGPGPPGNAGGGSDSDSAGTSSSSSSCPVTTRRPAEQTVQILGAAAGVIAVQKPAGHTTEKILAALRAQLSAAGDADAVLSVSRLDRMTSGVLIAAKGSLADAEALKEQYAGKQVRKEYICLCAGSQLGPVGHEGEISCRLRTGKARHRVAPSPHGKEAHTQYKVLAVFRLPGAPCVHPSDELAAAIHVRVHGPSHAGRSTEAPSQVQGGRPDVVASLLLVRPLTGRTHQIRVHMQLQGCPLVGDLKYGLHRVLRHTRALCPRLFLHCLRVGLRAADGEAFQAAAALPDDLLSALHALDTSLCPSIISHLRAQ